MLAVLPAGLTASFLEGRAVNGAPGLCQGRCPCCCMERNSAPVPAQSVPLPAVQTTSAGQMAFDKSSVVIRILPVEAKRITPALTVGLLSSAIPLFERYCTFLI